MRVDVYVLFAAVLIAYSSRFAFNCWRIWWYARRYDRVCRTIGMFFGESMVGAPKSQLAYRLGDVHRNHLKWLEGYFHRIEWQAAFRPDDPHEMFALADYYRLVAKLEGMSPSLRDRLKRYADALDAYASI